MVTGLVEIDGKKHYFSSDGAMYYNCVTEEGYRIDVDGKVVDENTPDLVYQIIVYTNAANDTGSIMAVRFINESNETFTVEPDSEIITNGLGRNLIMMDLGTLTAVDYGVVYGHATIDFYYVLPSYESFPVNDSSRAYISISYKGASVGYTMLLNEYFRVHSE